MNKIEIVKNLIKAFEAKGVFWICEHFTSLYLEYEMLASYDDINKIGEVKEPDDSNELVFYMIYPFDFEFFKETKKFKNLIENTDRKVVVVKFHYDNYREILYLKDIEWNKGDSLSSLKREGITLLKNLIKISFLEERVIPNLTKLGLKISVSAHDDMGRNYLVKVKNGEIKINKDLKKLWEESLRILKDIEYNWEIIENFPEKIKELKDINLDLDKFNFIN